jgi:hypothetical protein
MPEQPETLPIVTTGNGLILITTLFDATLATDTQVAVDVIKQVIISPVLNVNDEYCELLIPTLTPLTFHW